MKNPYPAFLGAMVVVMVVLRSEQETNAITETCLTRYQFHDHFMNSFLYESYTCISLALYFLGERKLGKKDGLKMSLKLTTAALCVASNAPA